MFLATNSPFTGVTLHLLSSYVRLVATNVTSDGADASPAAILFGMTTREFVAQIAQVINVSFLVDSSNIVLQSELGHVVSVSLTTTSLLFLNHTNFENVLFDVSNGCNISSQNMLLFATPKNWLRHSFSNTTFLIRRQSSIVIRGHGPLMVAFAFFAAEFGDADRNNQIIVDNASIHLIPLIPSASPPFPTRGKGGFMCSLVTASPSYSALVRDSSVNAIDAGYVSLILRNHSTFQVQYMIDDNPTTQPNVSLKGVDFGVDPLGMLMMFTNASGTSTTDAPPGFAISGINATVTGNVLVEGGSYVNLAGGRILGLVVIMALNGTATVTLQEKSRATIAPYGITAATGALMIVQNCPFVSVLALHITTSSVVWMSITAETFENLPCFDGCGCLNNNTTNSSSSTTIVNQKRQVSLMALLAQHSPVGLMSLTVSSQSMLNTSFFGLPTNSSEYPVNLSTVGVGLVAVISSSVVDVIAVRFTDGAAVHLDCVDCTGVLIAFAESIVTNLVELSVSTNSSTFVRALTTTPQDQIASLDSMLTSSGVNILGLGGLVFYKTDNAGTDLQTNLLLNESSSVTIFGAVLAVGVGIASTKGHVNISVTLQHHANLKVSSYGTAVGVTATLGVLADSFALVTMNSSVELSVDGAVSSGAAFQIFQAGDHLTSVLEISHFSSVFVNVSQNSSHVEGASDSSICVGGLIVVDAVANASFSFRTVTLTLLNSSQYTIEALDAVPTLVLIKDRMTFVNVDIAEESSVSVVGATTHVGVNILDLKEGSGDILYYFVGLASLMFYTKATIEREAIFAVRSASRVSLSSQTIMAFFIQDSNASAANVSILLYRDTFMNLNASGNSTSLLNALVLATGSNFSQLLISVSGDSNDKDGGYNNPSNSSNNGSDSSASQGGAQLIMTLRPTLWQGTQLANAVVFLRSQILGGALEFAVGNGGSFVLDAQSALALVIMSMDSTVGEGSALSVRAHTNGSIAVSTTRSCLVAGVTTVSTDFSGVSPKNLTGMAALILSFAGSMDGQGFQVNASSGCSIFLEGPMAAALMVLSSSSASTLVHSNIVHSITVESGGKLFVISASSGSMSFLASMMIVIGSNFSGVRASVSDVRSQLVISAPNATSLAETNKYWLANGLKLCFGISNPPNATNASHMVVTYNVSLSPIILAIPFFFQSSNISNFTFSVSQLGYVSVLTQNGTALLIVTQSTVLPTRSLVITSNGTLQIRTSSSAPLSLFGVSGVSSLTISDMPGVCATELLDQGLNPTASIINMTISTFGTVDARCVQAFFSIVSFDETVKSVASVIAGTFLIESNGSANFIATGNPYSLNAAIFVVPGSSIHHPHIQVLRGGSLYVAVQHDIVFAGASSNTFFATLVLAVESSIVDFVLQVTEGGNVALTTSDGITAAIVLLDGTLNGSTTSVDGENSIIRVVATSTGAPINFFETGTNVSSIAGVATWFFTTTSPLMTRMILAVNNRSSVVVSAPSVGLFFVMIEGVDGAILETLDIVVSDASILQMNATSFATLVAVSNASVSSINISVLNRSAIIMSYDSGQPQFSPALIGVLAFSSAAVANLTLNVIHGSSMQLLSVPLSNQTAVPITTSNFNTLITAGAAVIFLVSQLGSLGAAQIIVDSLAVAGTTAIPTAITLHATLATVLGCLTCFFNQTVSMVVRNPSASINVAAQGIGMLAAFQTPRRVEGVTIASSNSATLTLSLPSSSSVTNTNNKLAAFLVLGSSTIDVNVSIVNVSNLWLLVDTTSVVSITCTRCILGGLVASGVDIVVVNMTVRVRGASTLNLLCTVPLLTADMAALEASLGGGSFSPDLLSEFSTNSIAAVVALLSSVTVRDFHFQVYQRGSTLHATGAISVVMLAFGAKVEGAQCDVYDFGVVLLESGQGYGVTVQSVISFSPLVVKALISCGVASTFLFFCASATVDRVAINLNSGNITTFAALGLTASLVYFESAKLAMKSTTNYSSLSISLQNRSFISLQHQETSIVATYLGFPFTRAIPSFLHFVYINSGAMTKSSPSTTTTPSVAASVIVDGSSSIVLSIPAATGVLCGFMYLSKSTGVSMSLFLGGNSSITTPTLSSSTLAQTATTMSFIVRVGGSLNFSGSSVQLRGRVSLLPAGSIVEFSDLGNLALPQSSNNHVSVGLIDPIVEWVSTSTSTSGIGCALVRVSGNGAVLQGATIEIRNFTRFNMSSLGSGGGVVAIDASGITTSTTSGMLGGSITLADSMVSSSESAPLIAVRSSSNTANDSTIHVNLTRNQLYYTSRSSSLLQSRLSAAGPLMFLEPARSATITASQQRAFDILLDDNNFARYANLFDARSNLTFPDLIETHCTTFINGRGWVKYTITPVNRPMVLLILKQVPTALWNGELCSRSDTESLTPTLNVTLTPSSSNTSESSASLSVSDTISARSRTGTGSRQPTPSKQTVTFTQQFTTTETIIPPTPTVSLYVARRPCPAVTVAVLPSSISSASAGIRDVDFTRGNVILNLTLPDGIRWWNRPWEYDGTSFVSFSVVSATKPQPQGFTKYMSDVALTSSNATKWKFSGSRLYNSIVMQFPVAPSYELLLAETVQIQFDSRAIQFQCTGSIVATAQFQVSPASNSALIDATVSTSSIAAFSVLGSIGLSAADNQLLVILAGTKCSTAVLGGTTGYSAYLMSPFWDYGYDYMIVGNILLVFAVALVQNIGAGLYYLIFLRKQVGGPIPVDQREPGLSTSEDPALYDGPLTSRLDFIVMAWAKVQFPGLTYAVAVLLQQGTLLASAKIAFQGGNGSPASPVFALVYTIAFMYFFQRCLEVPKHLLITRQIAPMLHRSQFPEFEEYKEFKAYSVHWRLLNPLGRWGPREWTRMFGKYFGQMQPQYFHYGIYPAVMLLCTTIIAVLPFDGVGCIVQFALLGLVPVIAGVFVIARRPHRVPAVSALCGVIHLLAGVIAFITAYLSSDSANTTNITIQLVQLGLSTASSLLVTIRFLVTSRVFYCENFKWNDIPMSLKHLASATWNALLADSGGDLTRGNRKKKKRRGLGDDDEEMDQLPSPPPTPPSSDLSEDEDDWKNRPPRPKNQIYAEMTKVNDMMSPLQQNVNAILELDCPPPHAVDRLARLNQLVRLAAAENYYVQLLKELYRSGGWMPSTCVDEFDLR